MIPAVDQQLILQVLWRMEVFAGWLLAVTPSLDTVVAGGDSSILHLDGSRGMRKFAFSIWSRALIPLELPAYFEL